MAVHFILQGKGGVGKSFVATTLTQYFMDKQVPVAGFDLDPTNPTYCEYEQLPVSRINLLDAQNHIDHEKFILFGEELMEHPPEHEIIVDCGTSAYIAMMHFLEQLDFDDWLRSLGRRAFVHTVLKGGGELSDTFDSCVDLFDHFPKTPFIIWLNESQHPVLFDGKSFTDSQVYKHNRRRIVDVIPLPEYTAGFFKGDIDKMIDHRWTFNECIEGGNFLLVPKRCLSLYRANLWQRLDLFLKNYTAFEG